MESTAIAAITIIFLLYQTYRALVRKFGDLSSKSFKGRVLVLVLGDIGRSPRMQYHALSLANAGFSVNFVGFAGSIPLQSILNHTNISIHYIESPSKIKQGLSRLNYLLTAVARVIRQIVQLHYCLLFTIKRPDIILVQNPPAIPTLFVAQVVRLVRRSKLVIDWHNYGFTIMAINSGRKGVIVSFAEWLERFFGRFADEHFCVSEAMKRDLIETGKIRQKINILYDKAPDHFRRLSSMEIREFLSILKIKELNVIDYCEIESSSNNLYKLFFDGKDNRPAVIVSSTSWTEDEDFQLLLDAVQIYDEGLSNNFRNHPPLVLIITGRGPLKSFYENKISELHLNNCKIYTSWLTLEDYPKLLGSADLGICLHKSSSGLDLPMKVVDMLGCGLPVCAVGYSWYEQHQLDLFILKAAF